MQPTIVVADDEPLVRMTFERSLSGVYRVASAPDGEAAWVLIQAVRPAAVLLDLQMPRRSGFEVAAAMKADPTLAHTPIIFVSGDTSEATIRRGLALGAARYLTKPILPSALRAAVRDVLDAAHEPA